MPQCLPLQTFWQEECRYPRDWGHLIFVLAGRDPRGRRRAGCVISVQRRRDGRPSVERRPVFHTGRGTSGDKEGVNFYDS